MSARRLSRAARALLLAALLASGCRMTPEAPAAAAARLRQAPPEFATLHAAALSPSVDPLAVRETGLAGVSLGMTPEQVTARLGPARRTESGASGAWWEYEAGALRLLFAGMPARLVQVQAWAPSRFETDTMVRPLDPASRLERKYGKPTATVALSGGEAWVYATANVAYVLTPPDADGQRAVAAVIAGL